MKVFRQSGKIKRKTYELIIKFYLTSLEQSPMTEFLFLHNAQVHIYLTDGVGGQFCLKVNYSQTTCKERKVEDGFWG